MKTTFKRYAPGLYVDSTQTWVISRDIEATGSYGALYTIRELFGFGPLVDGVTMFPDYSHKIMAEFDSLADAKADIIKRNDAHAMIDQRPATEFEKKMFGEDY